MSRPPSRQAPFLLAEFLKSRGVLTTNGAQVCYNARHGMGTGILSSQSGDGRQIAEENQMATDTMNDILQQVVVWPVGERLELATRILRSLGPEADGQPPGERGEALSKLIGIWKTATPPGDAEVERIIEEERMRKHA